MGFFTKDKRKKYALWIALFVLVGSIRPPVRAYAAAIGTGQIIYTEEGEWLVETKVSPSPKAEKANGLEEGKPLTILAQVTGDDGKLWYQVSYVLKASGKTVTAYVPAEKVRLNGSLSTDTPVVIATGTINGFNVYVRDGAGTSGTQKLTYLDKGHKVEIYGQTTVGGVVWYNISCTKDGTSYRGWTCGTYITLDETHVDVTGDFADSLRQKGFPESYISSLMALHNKYPNWKFEAVKTGLDWKTVIASESVNGRNLVQSSEDDAKKSTSAGAYNWLTNTWTVYDGSTWVAAHPDYIAYCMDPRNYLDETNIFQFESLSYDAGQTTAGVAAILKGTFMEKDVKDADGTTLNYAQAFVNTGKAAGVSAYHLASRVRQEQGTAGTSQLISGTYKGYEGYYNYYNFGAYGSGSTTVIRNGLTYAKNQGWNTRYKSLLGGATLLGKNYINKGQDTLYFQKFNVVNKEALYSHQYMANVAAAISEGKSVAKGYTDKQQAFVFRIPVYTNMPQSAVQFTASGNPNNYLKTLSVSGLSLTPAFSSTTTSYSMVVDNSIGSINVSAAALSGKAAVSGTGTYNLAVGNNTIKVNCKSQSGATKTYTITVSRKAAAGGGTTTPDNPSSGSFEVTSAKYKMGSIITGVAPGTKASDFLAQIQGKGCTFKLVSAQGTENTGVVGTANKLQVFVGNELKAAYEVVIYGDVNGDGAVNALDMIKLNRHIIKLSVLSGSYLEAADANRQGDGINALDMIKLNRHIIGLGTIQQ